jgi:hypothetical protein
MKISTLFLLVFLLFICTRQSGATEAATQNEIENAKLSEISRRVSSGDYNALFEAAKLPAPVAVPYISKWAGWGPGPRPQSDQAARAALRQVNGYAAYLRDDVAKASAGGIVPVYDFIIMEQIATPEAAAVVASYLFDFKTTMPPDGDLLGDSNVGEAMLSLVRMKLPDAPSMAPGMLNSAELIAWQKWAIAKGYVPKDWSSRVGAPAWMLKMEAWKPPTPTPLATKSPSPVAASSPSSANVPAAAASKPLGYTAATLTAVILALLVLTGVFAWKRRS